MQSVNEQSLDDAQVCQDLENYRGFVYNVALRMVKNHEEARDVVQEVLIETWKTLRSGRVISMRSWLYRSTANACIDRLRRKKILTLCPVDEHAHELTIDSAWCDPVCSAIRHEERSIVRYVLSRMTPKYRTALVLHIYHGWSCEEIAALLKMPGKGAAKSILYRARLQFKNLFEKAYGSPATL